MVGVTPRQCILPSQDTTDVRTTPLEWDYDKATLAYQWQFQELKQAKHSEGIGAFPGVVCDTSASCKLTARHLTATYVTDGCT